jgi:hypothetical protein
MIVVFDLDGTIADCSHRLHYIEGASPDWEAFQDMIWKDSPILPMVELWRALDADVNTIIVCSGRPESARNATLTWLKSYELRFDAVHLRPEGDYRPAHIVKEKMLRKISDKEGALPALVFEDDELCVNMWRRNGILCCHVGMA